MCPWRCMRKICSRRVCRCLVKYSCRKQCTILDFCVSVWFNQITICCFDLEYSSFLQQVHENITLFETIKVRHNPISLCERAFALHSGSPAMASTFTFGFSGDDIEADIEDEIDAEVKNDEMQIDRVEEQKSELLPARPHSLEEIVSVSLFHIKHIIYSQSCIWLLVQTCHTFDAKKETNRASLRLPHQTIVPSFNFWMLTSLS